MNSVLMVRLPVNDEQRRRLRELQHVFAQACNALAPLVQRTQCWNRVALHHQAYRELRAQFPALGSQMACNAVYSVSRASRIVYQSPQSPFQVHRQQGRRLPRLQFQPNAPVYFDRHTLSLRDGVISLYTLDGRLRITVPIEAGHEAQFRERKLRELLLFERDGQYWLNFVWAPEPTTDPAPPRQAHPAATEAEGAFHRHGSGSGRKLGTVEAPSLPAHEPGPPAQDPDWPEYLVVIEEAPIPTSHASRPSADAAGSPHPLAEKSHPRPTAAS